MGEVEQHGIKEADWEMIVKRIPLGRCLPFIGPGLCRNYYLPKPKIADKWAQSLDYPFEDGTELARVAQFVDVHAGDEQTSKEKLIKELELSNCNQPNLADTYEPHRVLADLPFPIYITTNYDDYMIRALKDRNRDPRRDYCKWRDETKGLQRQPRQPNAANPLVFHLYGHTGEIRSLVLSEKDHMRFVVNVAKFPNLIPIEVQNAIGSFPSILFLGYQLDDWDFRILLTVLDRFYESGALRDQKHISVQLAPLHEKTPRQQRDRAQEYFNRYLENLRVSVYWGTCEQFTKELRDRWKV